MKKQFKSHFNVISIEKNYKSLFPEEKLHITSGKCQYKIRKFEFHMIQHNKGTGSLSFTLFNTIKVPEVQIVYYDSF